MYNQKDTNNSFNSWLEKIVVQAMEDHDFEEGKTADWTSRLDDDDYFCFQFRTRYCR